MTIAINNIIIVSTFFLQLQAIEKCHHLSYEDISFLETHPRNEYYSRFEQTKKKHTYQKRCTHESVILFIVHYFAERIPETLPMVYR